MFTQLLTRWTVTEIVPPEKESDEVTYRDWKFDAHSRLQYLAKEVELKNDGTYGGTKDRLAKSTTSKFYNLAS